MTFFFAISKWNRGGEFASILECDTAEAAEALGRKNETTYGDQTFIRVVEAATWNDVQPLLNL